MEEVASKPSSVVDGDSDTSSLQSIAFGTNSAGVTGTDVVTEADALTESEVAYLATDAQQVNVPVACYC